MISIVFLESQYEELNEVVDEVAERVAHLGRGSVGQLNRVFEADEAEGTPWAICGTLEMVKNLLTSHERLFSPCVWIWKAVPISVTTWGRVIPDRIDGTARKDGLDVTGDAESGSN